MTVSRPTNNGSRMLTWGERGRTSYVMTTDIGPGVTMRTSATFPFLRTERSEPFVDVVRISPINSLKVHMLLVLYYNLYFHISFISMVIVVEPGGRAADRFAEAVPLVSTRTIVSSPCGRLKRDLGHTASFGQIAVQTSVKSVSVVDERSV